MVFPGDQIIRPGPPRPSVVMRPGSPFLAPGEERYTVTGGGVIAVPIGAGDQLRLVDLEGMQACEVVAVDAAGIADPAILGARADGNAVGLRQILSGASESARSVRAGLERRGIDLARARAINLFGGESRAGDDAHFTVTRDGLLIVAAAGGAMAAGAQDTATPIRVHIQRSRLRPASETPLPEPLADPLQDIRVNQSTAEAYIVRAGEYIQIIDVAGRQCTDFQCFRRAETRQGLGASARRHHDAVAGGQELSPPRLVLKGLRSGHGRRWSRWSATRSVATMRSALPATRAIMRTRAIPAMSIAQTISTRSSRRTASPRAKAGWRSTSSTIPASTTITCSISMSRGRGRGITCCCARSPTSSASRRPVLTISIQPMAGTPPTSMCAPIPTSKASPERWPIE